MKNMNSSEIVYSGRSSGRRSSFSQTCSLLSQFLKEKGSFEDLSLSLTNKNSETKEAETTTTMSLFPMIEKPGQNSGSRNPDMPLNIFPQQHTAVREETYKKPIHSGSKPDPETAPLTIFYAGQVLVFKDFPADKAQEIMTVATRNHQHAAFAPPHVAESPAESTTSTRNIVPTFGIQELARPSLRPVLGSDLPIARKKSLARFLEKRKDRITANAPYQAYKPKESAPKPAKAEAWLGLAPEFSFQTQQRH